MKQRRPGLSPCPTRDHHVSCLPKAGKTADSTHNCAEINEPPGVYLHPKGDRKVY